MANVQVRLEKMSCESISLLISQSKNTLLSELIPCEKSESTSVSLDHSYSKSANAHPEAKHAMPIKCLFMNRNIIRNVEENDNDSIDVVTIKESNTLSYDKEKANEQMNEIENLLQVANLNKDKGSLEKTMAKYGWNSQQTRLFTKVMRVFQHELLARLAYSHTTNEPIFRRISITKAARRFRHALGSVFWETKLIQWLHSTLIENLSCSSLAVYYEILQTLTPKIPKLIERLMLPSKHVSKLYDSIEHNSFVKELINRPWDPILNTGMLNKHKLQKLPGDPVMIIIPNELISKFSPHSRRTKFWNSQLSEICKTFPLSFPQMTKENTTCIQYMDILITCLKDKITYLQHRYKHSPIVLVGWNFGATLCMKVALEEHIAAIVCLNFNTECIEGKRGECDDILLELSTPTLFVVGQLATLSSIDNIEEFREKMRAENALLAVGGADDNLHICTEKLKSLGFTQAVIDKCIMEEMAEFLGTILTQELINSHSQSNETISTMEDSIHNNKNLLLKRRTASKLQSARKNLQPKLKSSFVSGTTIGNKKLKSSNEFTNQLKRKSEHTIPKPMTKKQRPPSQILTSEVSSLPSFSSFVTSQSTKNSNAALAHLASKLGMPVSSVMKSGITNLPISQIVTLSAKQKITQPSQSITPTSPTMTALLNKPVEMGPPAPILESLQDKKRLDEIVKTTKSSSDLYSFVPVGNTNIQH